MVNAAFVAVGLVAAPLDTVRAQTNVESRAAALQAGEYVWREDAATTGDVAIVISLPSQLAYVYRGGKLVGISTVSTGKPGKDTPVGAFTILQKKVFHRSNLYSDAPMPFMQRLTWTGIALHAGDLPGYPASHGCIRFPADFAERLFDLTRMGGKVRVIDTAVDGVLPRAAPREIELPPVLIADRGVLTGPVADDRVLARAEPLPRIELANEDVRFAVYDAVFAEGYGAKGGARKR
ncbi:L,D-transpeptidase family protein [Sphingomonas sp. S1-29]|uniref:L,D-transpeptidase family protein n=1 Tax=Sphingomonas sp. S1-29 TaxID=2991074 RepID=UPI00223F64B5|nr:L,D-transpeptidase family protein [Sphingomonas sp. S1-29]UZK70554.1 L,D-transpeptidase family protein [Sphingomonas sp. S1-29]